MAAARANWRCIAVVVLAGTLASVAHGEVSSAQASWRFGLLLAGTLARSRQRQLRLTLQGLDRRVLRWTKLQHGAGASYTVSWGFNTSAVFVPELAVNCGDNVTFRLAANQTHDVVQVVPVVPSLARFPSELTASGCSERGGGGLMGGALRSGSAHRMRGVQASATRPSIARWSRARRSRRH